MKKSLTNIFHRRREYLYMQDFFIHRNGDGGWIYICNKFFYMDYTRWIIRGTGDVFTNKFTCNFIEGEGNTCYKETYYINPADIRRFLNRNKDEGYTDRRWQNMINSWRNMKKKLDKHFS